MPRWIVWSRDLHGPGRPSRNEPKRAGLTNRQNGTGRAFSSNRLGFICNISKRANFVAVGPAASIVDILPVSPTVEAPSKNRQLQDFEDVDKDEEPIVDEVSRYIECHVKPAEVECILGWWKKHASSFPKLATVARFILDIPASSAASVRSLSAAGQTISDRRTNLALDTVDDILFVQCSLKFAVKFTKLKSNYQSYFEM